MSDTPIAERLAAELGMSWPLRPPRHHLEGSIFEDSEPGALGSESRLGGPEGAALLERGRTRLTRGETDG